MEEKKKINFTKGKGLGYIVALLVVVLFVFILMIREPLKEQGRLDKEKQLIEEGKTKTHNEVINEIIEILRDKKESELKKYLADSFKYYNNDKIESKYISGFLKDLDILSSSYDIERRGDTHQDSVVTYRIYWNVVEENKKKGIDKTDRYYCLQRITIMLKRIVNENEITYEIEKIILTDN